MDYIQIYDALNEGAISYDIPKGTDLYDSITNIVNKFKVRHRSIRHIYLGKIKCEIYNDMNHVFVDFFCKRKYWFNKRIFVGIINMEKEWKVTS